jgi:hypothetical protein
MLMLNFSKISQNCFSNVAATGKSKCESFAEYTVKELTIKWLKK